MHFYALSLDKIINGTLGVRSFTYNGNQWDEIMSAMSDVFLRAKHSASTYSRIQDIREWKRVEIGSQETEVGSVMSMPYDKLSFG